MDQTLLRLGRVLSLDLDEGKKEKEVEPIQANSSKHQAEPDEVPSSSGSETEDVKASESAATEDSQESTPSSEHHQMDAELNGPVEEKDETDAPDAPLTDPTAKGEESPSSVKFANPASQKSQALKTTSNSSTSASNFYSKGPSPLIQSLLGLTTPTFSQDPSLPLPPFNPSLNSIQISSISRMISADHFSLLHGPPGTGKTTALAELILQLTVGLRKRVLVCGASNLAVDNLMEKMLESGREALKKEGMGVTRVGHPARILPSLLSCTLDNQSTASDEGQLIKDISKELNQTLSSLSPRSSNPTGSSQVEKPQPGNKSVRTAPKLSSSARRAKWEEVKALRAEYRKRERGVTISVLSRAQIVLSTCHGAGGKLLERGPKESGFDVVIIDEACQAMEAVCWIPILRAKWDGKLILAGDHLQLPPTVKSMKQDKQMKGERFKRKKEEKKKRNEGIREKKEEGDQEVEEVGDGVEKMELKDEGKIDETSQEKDETEDIANSDSNEEASDLEGEEEETAGTTFVQPKSQTIDPQASSPATSPTQGETGDTPKAYNPSLRPPRSLETTLFSRLLGLYGPGCKSLLRVQYRMNSEIMSFPNQAMYEGQLLAAESCEKGRLIDLDGFEKNEIGGKDQQDQNDEELDEEFWAAPLVFYDTSSTEMFESSGGSNKDKENPNEKKSIRSLQSVSKSNENEVSIVIDHLTELIKHGLTLKDIGIIAPYSAQVSLLSSSLRDHFSTSIITSLKNKDGSDLNLDFNDLEIGTVDGLQGREKEAVILTLVRSNLNKEVGFLAERRRLNVAMTRAKKHLAVICDAETVGRAKDAGTKERIFLKDWMNQLEEKSVLVPVGI